MSDETQKDYPFFANKECAYFPCHETDDPDNFNCIFCYCPLYTLGEECGGNFTYTAHGKKSCIGCILPHLRDEGTRRVLERYPLLEALAARKEEGER